MKKKSLIVLAIVTSMCVLAGCSDAADAAPTAEPAETEEVADMSAEEGLLPDDTGGEEFIADEMDLPNLCLTGGEYLFKDYTCITNEYNEADGTYYDEYISEDGIQAIYEKGVMDYNTDIAMEDYMLEEATKLAGDSGVMNASLEQASYDNGLSYPAYIAKFYSGSNEDTRSWIVYVVDTDNGLFMYGLSCAADYEDDMFYDAEDVFPKLMIEENYRGLVSDDADTVDVVDLLNYLGSSIEEASEVIPALEQDGEQYSSKEEVAADGSLAGPFVDVDADGLVTGITYSGNIFCIESLWIGTSVADGGEYLKELGWNFESVDFAHGTAQYVVTYSLNDMELVLVSDEAGDFDKSEESDVTGCIATISVYNK